MGYENALADYTELLKRLKAAIPNDAPNLAALLDGANAAVAISALGKTLLGDNGASLQAVTTEAEKGDKSRILAAEQEAQLRVRQSGAGSLDTLAARLEVLKAAYADTQAARQRQIESHDLTNRWFAFIVSAAFIGLIVALIFKPISVGDNKGLLFTLLGVVATGWANIIGFYFGSSAGSMLKSSAIDAVLSRTPSVSSAGQ